MGVRIKSHSRKIFLSSVPCVYWKWQLNMATALLPVISPHVSGGMPLPALVLNAGNKTAWRFVGFSTAIIRNPHTREAYFCTATAFLGCGTRLLLQRVQEERATGLAGS